MTTPADILDALVAALDEDDLSEIRRTVLHLHTPEFDEVLRNEGTREVIAECLRGHLRQVQ
jgi:hypothetical protein